MSCCGSQGMDCGKALNRLTEFLDGEVGPPVQEEVAEHLSNCGSCLQEFEVERLVKAVVARSCCVSAPRELRARVKAQIDSALGKGHFG